jgi:hypothetical protein
MAGKKPTKLKAPEACPVCGEDVPRGVLACPECGADHGSGWREEADTYDGVNLPDEDFNYDKFVQEGIWVSAKASRSKNHLVDFRHRPHRCFYSRLLLRGSLNSDLNASGPRLQRS